MWLPDGWITAVPGLSRKDQLHKIGNGVVPTQAYEAYRSLLAQAGLAQWREAA
jgi:DNA (cytosine-5)-methyltransferase 1